MSMKSKGLFLTLRTVCLGMHVHARVIPLKSNDLLCLLLTFLCAWDKAIPRG